MLISQTTPDEHPRRHRLAGGQLSSFYPPSPSFSSFGAASVMCSSASPACSSTPLRPSVHYTSSSLVVNIMCIQTFCDHLNVLYFFNQKDLYRFEDRLQLYGANAGLVVSPPSLSLSPPGATTKPMASPHQFTLSRQVQLIWRRLCEPLLSSSSLAGQKQPSLLSHLCLICRRYKVVFP